MKLVLKQKLFSWFDSYDVYNEFGEVAFRIKGEFAWGHLLRLYDVNDVEVGYIKERVISFLPKFELYQEDQLLGEIQKELSFLKPKFHLSFNDWKVQGDIWEWDYNVSNEQRKIMNVYKELAFSDTYVLNIEREEDALHCLMIVLAIDAMKCSKN